jgi:hypothetical protein
MNNRAIMKERTWVEVEAERLSEAQAYAWA